MRELPITQGVEIELDAKAYDEFLRNHWYKDVALFLRCYCTPKQRAVIEMRFGFFGHTTMTFRAIAQELHLSVSTVYAHYNRAMVNYAKFFRDKEVKNAGNNR